jgi:hypothetical protein
MVHLLTFERYIERKWRRRIKKEKNMKSRKPILEPMNPDEMVDGREYDQTETGIVGQFIFKV